MDVDFTTLGLWGLFASSFLSSTLLPGNSEIVLLALLQHAPALAWPAIAVATVGNTLGGLTTYLLGRLVPRPRPGRTVEVLARYGPAALLFSWLPVVGDGLCVASGWLRQNALLVLLFLAIGKGARYWALATGWAWFRG